RPLPIGVAGEIYIGGEQVAQGYLGRRSLTAERFIPDPFSGRPGSRLYRTGDLASWGADGSLQYLGRNDLQIKIRGYRVEPGEIEALLLEHAHVREAAVVVREARAGSKRLIAYVTLHAGGATGSGALRQHLKDLLPSHMVPSAF